MKLFDTLRFRLAALFRRSQMSTEAEEELRSHIEHRADDLERSGLTRAEAERRARLEFGGQARFREESLEAAGGKLVESVLQDLRYALRMLRKSPGFTGVAVGTLALAIGANAVVFAILNALILRPLNVPEGESLYLIERGTDHFPSQSYPDYVDLRDRNRSFDGVAACNIGQAGLETGDSVSPAMVYEASGNYFDVLHIQPYLGRFFHAADEHGANSAPYVVLTYAYWHSHFQDDRSVVGRAVRLNKHLFTIVGVAPAGFHGTMMFMFPDAFVPIVNQEQIEGADFLTVRGNRWVFMTLGHLKPGVTQAQATADLNSIGSYLEKTYPQDHKQVNFSLAHPSLYGDYLERPAQAFLGGLMLLAGLILLAACANLGSLFAARAADRSREVALRLALGSSRMRVLGQLFTEAILISLIGGAIGLWGSVVLLQSLSVWRPFPEFPINIPVSPDVKVYGVALLLAVASGFLFGAVPVRQVLETNPYGVIKAGSIIKVGRRITVRDVLLGAQIAICAVLVTSSLVALRGMVRSLRGNFGFEAQNSMLVQADLHMAGYDGDAVPVMHKRMIEAMKTIPGVWAAATIDQAPMSNGRPTTATVFKDETGDLKPANSAGEMFVFNTSPGYFQAAGTRLLAGREFTWEDDKNAPRVAVINQQFAREVFEPGMNAVGRYYKMQDGTRVQVVGIVEDGKFTSLTEDPQPAVFFPIAQSPSNTAMLVIRSGGDSQQLAAAIRSKLRELDAGLPALIQTRTGAMQFVLFPARMATASLGVLGLMGAVLSVTGVFGLAAYSVSKRKRELGIRMALGAQRSEVVQAALGRAVKLLAFGSAVGLALGILASRVLASIVYQATPRDPVVLAGVVAAMALLGVVATWIPARRALSLDPVALLRED